MDPLIERERDRIERIAAKYGAGNIRLFGSRARGDAARDSDIDLLVEMAPGCSLLDLIALEQELRAELGVDVDVLTPASLSPYLRADIEREAIPL